MIGSVRGTVIERTTDGDVLVEVGGVGYRARVPLSAVPALEPGGPAFLFTHLHVRDDEMVLYAFPTRDERDTFEVLLGTSGVGPRLALAILGVHPPSALRRILVDDDLESLTLVPGVGRRTAQRLLLELKSRLEVPEVDLAAAEPATTARAEVREALVGLGYAADEVREAMRRVPDDGPVEDLLRAALKVLAAP